MHSISTQVSRLLFGAKRTFDRQKLRWKRRLGWLEPVVILPYRSYGTPRRLSVRGRVLEDLELNKVGAESSAWRNMLHVYRHFHTDEIPDARVRVRYGELEQEVQADGDGFFETELTLTESVDPAPIWHEVGLTLVTPLARGQEQVQASAPVLVPPADAEFGIISDIDDTVIITGANDFLRNLRTNLLNNAQTRRPFPGVDAFYSALQLGPDRRGHNPIFYVSSSAWNIYPIFVDLLDHHDIPRGPLLLRDIGLDRRKFFDVGHKDYKLNHLRPIFDAYPELSFVLVGDSGQEDPEIYRQMVEEYPGRVLAIYIRDVTSDERDAAVHQIADDLAARGVPMVLATDSVAAAQHAAEHQLISPEAVEMVREDCERDQRRPRGKG